MKHFARLALLGLSLLGACRMFEGRVSLLDEARRAPIERPTVVIVPGILGSILADRATGDVEWVRASQAFLVGAGPDLDFTVDAETARRPARARDALVPVGVLTEVPVVAGLYSDPIYRPLIAAFEKSGFKTGSCDFPRADENAFLFAYDFRQDAASSARELARAIERIRDTRANPDEKVVIVAHSFGGLLVRYYLMYGDRDALDGRPPAPDGAGARRVSKVVFLGTPHHGAVSLFEFFFQGYGVFYNGQLLGADDLRSMPALYQLLPCPDDDCFLDGSSREAGLRPYREDGARLRLYDPQTWVRLGWLPDSWRSGPRRQFFEEALTRGSYWWAAVDAPWRPPDGLEMVNVAGASTPTPARAVLAPDGSGGLGVSFALPWRSDDPREELRRARVIAAGDLRVTAESAFDYPYARRIASVAEHDFVHHDEAVLANVILFVLGDRFLPALRNAEGAP